MRRRSARKLAFEGAAQWVDRHFTRRPAILMPMRLLATNMLVWKDVKPRIKWGMSVLPIGLMFSAFVPIFAIVIWLDGVLDLGSGGQSHELLWLVLFLSALVVLMQVGYALGWVLNAAISMVVFGWPSEKIKEVFLESKIPAEWQLPAPDTAQSGKAVSRRAAWAVTREKGRWHFVLVQGVLGWGGAMFVGIGLMPVLTHRHEPSWPYFISQVFVWVLAGAFFGFATWSWNERSFKRQSASDGSQ